MHAGLPSTFVGIFSSPTDHDDGDTITLLDAAAAVAAMLPLLAPDVSASPAFGQRILVSPT
jgi:hypothetical protein